MTSEREMAEAIGTHEVGRGAPMERAVIAGLLPAGCVAALVLPVVLFGDDLPDRVASHFDASGTPDGSMTPTQLLLWSGLLLVMPGVLMMMAAGARSGRMPRPWPPFLAGLGAFLAILGAGIAVETVVTQRGLEDWTEASSPGMGFVAVIGAAAVGGVVAALLGKNLPYNRESTAFAADPNGDVPTMDLADGERVVFIETISPGWLLWLTATVLAIAVALAVLAVWSVAAVMAVSALPLLLFLAMRVQADQDGLTVRSTLFGFRFAKIKTEEIEQATVIDVEPMKWGGWGYRGSLKLAGTAAVVLRRGPGIHLKLTGDRVFVVTLDNPRGAAAVLNADRELSNS